MKKVDGDTQDKNNLIKLEGVDGLWYEQPDILSKYKRRDDRLEKICYTQYGKMIRSGGKNVENYDKSIDSDDYDDDGEGEVPEFYEND